MNPLEYSEVELPFIEQLQQYGYTYIKGTHLENDRTSKASLVLEKRFASAIQKLNPWIDSTNIDRVVKQFITLQAEDLWHANKTIFDWLFGQGISVMQDVGAGKKNQTVRLFDYEQVENNDFVVAGQITYENAAGKVIPDLVLYINGLPLILIECKSPKLQAEKQLPEGVRQFERYMETNEKLFWYNQMLIVTSRDRARVGTIFAKPQHYGLWKDPYPYTYEESGSDRAQDVMVSGMLRKEAVLDLMRNFIVFDGKVKKLARYQQYRAVNKTMERMTKEKKPSLRGGVVWHTQGSGKSLTMVYLAMKLRRQAALENPMLVIVTDRQDLDDQITKTFQQSGFPNPTQATSVTDLKLQLGKGPGTTVMTLIQKFQGDEEKAFPIISQSENIIVMTDESHRSQYKGFALNMRKALPNATFIGFTGTPIDKKTRSTTGKFGGYIDKYTIEQAVEDGATVAIHYESRLPSLHMKGDTLDELFARTFFEYDEEAREKMQQKYVNDQLLLTAPERMKEVALDIVRHFESRILVNGYKGQVVAISRTAATEYKKLIDQYAMGQFETAVIFSAGQNDTEELRKYHISKEEEKQLIERFKKPFAEDKLALLIVCDKLLTGFDAPIEQVMYLDKPLREHNLLQAIARTNRKYDANKKYGLIVDYFGVSRFLDQALEIFSANDVQGALQSIDDELPRLEQRHRATMRFFDGLGPVQWEESVLRLVEEDVRADFDIAYKRFAESMDKVMPSPKAERFLHDLKRVGTIRQLAKSRFSIDDGMDISDCGEKVRQLVHDYLHAAGIDARDPVSILDVSFQEELQKNTLPETKAAQMEHAIKKEISVRLGEDEVFYTSLKQRVEELLARYKERQLTIFELLERLDAVREEMVDKVSGKTDSGLSYMQEPYYNKLYEVCESRADYELKEIAIEVQQFIEERVTPISDWTSKTDFKRQLTADLKVKLLKKMMNMNDASMLTGYFTALAETQYGKK
ncbi:type I restriction endonuclease subunit R [Brevibacillus porteri]|uniref:Type I restriction enzyme endonuclease subunit n=1 Tax=Brevibacillus porteri TaxID=2126350 RepID=A0ABX5FTB2_9BACL|nr:HsdR family type I site-specific deoxyribonuclease [Brevibacillus porteri]MED1797380.1 HsdR family type I site-specific deoxyribonuclease [Brevibacillus porteri]MED2129450.1 HsdR family type I site-specific deoxyribonuclease [Brevibacillus porteri]MED2747627.1 HsdR family type I site-specific deoxyribonuclease [Brevibacillus porteri]MED2815642.1 HsdR family type I site-specific deoxyribonuclease [Brevibacillus porteri]MED2896755.1 HsdR family type I site-specific deoxyribonuclease [Brevibac